MRKKVFLRIPILLLCVFAISHLAAQEKVITGIIKDETGTPLSNATIRVKNGIQPAISELNGAFRLSVPANTVTLVVSFVGMQPKKVSVEGKSIISVTLDVVDSKLNDMVVVGYGTKRRADITSSIASISAKDIKNLPVAGVDQALQGKVAGVTGTNNTGQPGGGVSVRVLGITSVNVSEPLYVIDGVPILTNTNSVPQDQCALQATGVCRKFPAVLCE